MLIDAGPDGSALKRLDEILPPQDRYIDLAMISHPQLDHFGGLPAIMRHYEIGALLVNGRLPDTEDPTWTALMNAVKESHTAVVILREGDSIASITCI
jgi:beta-lactamase superfamily II metal-dependent hydrolase